MAFVSAFPGSTLFVAAPARAPSVVRASAAARRPPSPAAAALPRRALLAGACATALALAAPAAPARADHTQAAARRSFDRYFPRIESGLEEARAVREAVKSGDVARARELAAAKTFDIKFKRALNIYATSFSDSNVNKKSLELLACVNGFYDGVAKAVSASSTEAAVADWNKAAAAMEAYIRVARLAKLQGTTLTI